MLPVQNLTESRKFAGAFNVLKIVQSELSLACLYGEFLLVQTVLL